MSKLSLGNYEVCEPSIDRGIQRAMVLELCFDTSQVAEELEKTYTKDQAKLLAVAGYMLNRYLERVKGP